MKSGKNKSKSIIPILLEKVLEILLRNECKKIDKININVFTSTRQIFKGIINEINIIAKGVNYKELIFNT